MKIQMRFFCITNIQELGSVTTVGVGFEPLIHIHPCRGQVDSVQMESLNLVRVNKATHVKHSSLEKGGLEHLPAQL